MLGLGYIVTLLDVGDPLHVTTLSTLSIAMAGWDILLGGSVPDGMVYLCSEAEGLTACSIADPSAPVAPSRVLLVAWSNNCHQSSGVSASAKRLRNWPKLSRKRRPCVRK